MFEKQRHKLKDGFHRSIGQKPAYIVNQSGVEVRWFDFSDPGALPFDPDTYNDSQLFLGSWANPWHVDLDAIEREYSRYEYDDPITDLIKKKHVIPSQAYKSYMNQRVVNYTFNLAAVDWDRIKYAVYATLVVVMILLLVTIT